MGFDIECGFSRFCSNRSLATWLEKVLSESTSKTAFFESHASIFDSKLLQQLIAILLPLSRVHFALDIYDCN